MSEHGSWPAGGACQDGLPWSDAGESSTRAVIHHSCIHSLHKLTSSPCTWTVGDCAQVFAQAFVKDDIIV